MTRLQYGIAYDVPVFEANRRDGRDADLSPLRRLPIDGNNALVQPPFAMKDDGMVMRRRPMRIINSDSSRYA